MDCSTPGVPVLHYLLEFAQTHAHWVDDAIQPSCPLSPPSPALNLSQHQGLFQWVQTIYLENAPRISPWIRPLGSGDPHHGFVHQECPDPTSPHSFPNICVWLCSCSTHHIGDIIQDLTHTLLVKNVLNYRDGTINFPLSLSVEKCTVHVFCEVWELWENMVYLGDSEQIWLCPGGSKGTQLTLAGRGQRRHDLALGGTEVPG